MVRALPATPRCRDIEDATRRRSGTASAIVRRIELCYCNDIPPPEVVVLRLICAAMLIASPAAARTAAAMTETWGKPGVAYDQYRRDAVDCALIGATRDVSGDEPARTFVRGWRIDERFLNDPAGPDVERWLANKRLTQPDRRIDEVQAILVNDVETCLMQRGYRKVQLSKPEQRALQRLRHGTERRRRFLHDIATREVRAE
jgi:hypothetical protein